MTPEQIEKKSDLATDAWLSKQTIGEGLPDFYSAMKATGHHIGYKQGYTDALSDAKEDAISLMLWCQDKGYQRVRGREYWIDLKGVKVADSVYQLYDLYQTSKTK